MGKIEAILFGCGFPEHIGIPSPEWDQSIAEGWGSFFDDGGHLEIWIDDVRPLDEVASSPAEAASLLARSRSGRGESDG